MKTSKWRGYCERLRELLESDPLAQAEAPAEQIG
jgi:hypothetical protein